MRAAVVERPTPALLALGAAGAGLLGVAAAALLASGPSEAFLILVVAVLAAAGILLLPWVDPAIPLTLGLLASVLSGNWDFVGIPFGVDRPLLLYGLAGAALRLLPDARNPGRIGAARLHRLHVLLAAVALYAIASAVFAGTLLQREPLFGLLDRLGLIGFGLFALAPLAFGTARGRGWLLGGLLVLGAYLSLTAIFEITGARGLVFPRYINNPGLGIHFERARGPFLEAAANGLALYTCFVAAAVGFATWRRPWLRALCVLVAAGCALGLLLTLTRQVWLGGIVATSLTALLIPRLRPILVPALVVGALGVLAAFAVVPNLQEQASSRAESRQPVWDRLNSNRAAVAMIDDRPLFGFGWYRFAEASVPYYEQAPDYPLTSVGRAHNVFLGQAVELGLVGALLWTAALIAVLATAIVGRAPPDLEPWRLGLVAVAVNWLVIANFTPLGYAFANHVLWLWAGVVCARHVGAWQPGSTRAAAPAPAPARLAPT